MNLEVFLRTRVCRTVLLHAFGSLATLVFGAVALVITFWFVYGAIWFGFQWCLPHSHQTRLLISAAFLVILFIGNARTDRDYLNSYEVETVDGREPYTIDVPEVGILSNLNFLSPATINSLTKVIAQLLFIGPQLISASWRLAFRSAQLARIEAASAARVVERLQSRKGRVPFAELIPAVGGEIMDAALRDLRMLDAIQFLDSPPPGVMLTTAFRETIARESGSVSEV